MKRQIQNHVKTMKNEMENPIKSYENRIKSHENQIKSYESLGHGRLTGDHRLAGWRKNLEFCMLSEFLENPDGACRT